MSNPNFKNRTIWTGDNLPIMRGHDGRANHPVDLRRLHRLGDPHRETLTVLIRKKGTLSL